MIFFCMAIGSLAGYVTTRSGSRIYGAVRGACYGLVAGILIRIVFSLGDLLNRSYF